MSEARQIERMNWRTFCRDVRSIVRRGRPVVVEAVSGLPFMRWTHGRLRDTCGERVVQVVRFPSNELAYDDRQERTIVRLSVARYLDWTANPRGMSGTYNLGRSLIDNYPGLRADVQFPAEVAGLWSRRLAFPQISLWVGKRGIVSPLHFDTLQNLNFQITGRKEWRLYSPSDLRYQYHYPGHTHAGHISRVSDSADPDLRKFPDFAHAAVHHAATKSGDLIYVPYGWSHQVTTLGEENINLNVWWVPSPAVLIKHWPQSLRGLALTWHRRGRHPFQRFENKNSRRARVDLRATLAVGARRQSGRVTSVGEDGAEVRTDAQAFSVSDRVLLCVEGESRPPAPIPAIVTALARDGVCLQFYDLCDPLRSWLGRLDH